LEFSFVGAKVHIKIEIAVNLPKNIQKCLQSAKNELGQKPQL